MSGASLLMSEWRSPTLIRLAAEAEPMTPALWKAMRDQYAHGRARSLGSPRRGHKRKPAGVSWAPTP